MIKQALLAAAFVAATAPLLAQAAEPRSVSCSVNVQYLQNNVLRSTYAKDIVLVPGTPFADDFSTLTRFRFFDALATQEADRSTTVSFSYFNDVGVFDSVDFSTRLKIRDDKEEASTSASHSYWTTTGGDHRTEWTMACLLLKN